jgi:lincosamide nucleotidyltransferase A/C/D/E
MDESARLPATAGSPEMTLDDVLAFLDLIEDAEIDVVVDGGWGVDALLGWQSRTHQDLDIAVKHRHVPLLRKVLEVCGYADALREDSHTYNFVLGDAKSHLIDVHSYEFDDTGVLLFGVPYPLDSLTGTGTIGRRAVCITPERMIEFRCEYEGDENDYQDVLALCSKFELPLPEYYALWPTLKPEVAAEQIEALPTPRQPRQ